MALVRFKSTLLRVTQVNLLVNCWFVCVVSLTKECFPTNVLSQSLHHAEYMAGKCYLYGFANGLDLSTYGNGLDADGVKLYCAQMSKNVADRAIQVMGGYGYVGEYTVERLWRDAKLLEIGGGTNESHHKNMARDLLRLDGNKLE